MCDLPPFRKCQGRRGCICVKSPPKRGVVYAGVAEGGSPSTTSAASEVPSAPAHKPSVVVDKRTPASKRHGAAASKVAKPAEKQAAKQDARSAAKSELKPVVEPEAEPAGVQGQAKVEPLAESDPVVAEPESKSIDAADAPPIKDPVKGEVS